jgi:uncharacterized coiled-coil DUF342 family protein
MTAAYNPNSAPMGEAADPSWVRRNINVISTLISALAILFALAGAYFKLEGAVSHLRDDNLASQADRAALHQKIDQHVQDSTRHLDPIRDLRTQDEFKDQIRELKKQMESLSNQIFQLNNELRSQRR